MTKIEEDREDREKKPCSLERKTKKKRNTDRKLLAEEKHTN